LEVYINEFSWSISRDATFKRCLREYYYTYYRSWGGWYWHATPEVKKTYTLKNLTSIPGWIGSVVHNSIAWQLRRISHGKPPEIAYILKKVEDDMRFQWWYSQTGYWMDEPIIDPSI